MITTDRIWELMARKLAAEASSAEMQELDQLLRVHPDLHVPVQTITDLWRYRAENSDVTVLEEAYNHHLNRMQEMGIAFVGPSGENSAPPAFLIEREYPSRRQRLMIWLAAACLLLIAGGLVFWLASQPGSPAEPLADKAFVNEIATRNGSRTSVHLPDGTQVWLNAGSKLTYDKQFGSGKREVTLTGEAFFDVARNPSIPFIIHTARIDVKVLGTRFNLKSYPGEQTSEAALVNGSIEVSIRERSAQRIILQANEKIVVGTNDSLQDGQQTKLSISQQEAPPPIMVVSKLNYAVTDSSLLETSWLQNKLAFKDESFRDVAAKMERWYNVKIRFADRSLETLRFTGTFETETIGQALQALQITGEFRYRFVDNKTVMISK
ncbi:MAG: DUF4974 domain-containing protein [Candidatus Pseudobacter hemicellulosilyticus]|uniref:DUF4974 domain-containing protein n=1 Tax=Candidatus Pseudobacter hemicellulosilyticus TaxID=3121375 RepID=A0AAJ6BHC6_9BACT|nr:MAG: DUF4974 domain-containing protein [Pseudobacter sp.]